MDYKLVEAKLREKLALLEDRLDHVTKDMSQSHSADFAEQVTERENDEVLEGIEEVTEASIRNIRAALARINEGTYGQCTRCGESIHPERLEVLPETALCVVCASE